MPSIGCAGAAPRTRGSASGASRTGARFVDDIPTRRPRLRFANASSSPPPGAATRIGGARRARGCRFGSAGAAGRAARARRSFFASAAASTAGSYESTSLVRRCELATSANAEGVGVAAAAARRAARLRDERDEFVERYLAVAVAIAELDRLA